MVAKGYYMSGGLAVIIQLILPQSIILFFMEEGSCNLHGQVCIKPTVNIEIFQIIQVNILINYILMPLGLLQSQPIMLPIQMMAVLYFDGLQDSTPISWLKIYTTLVILVGFTGLQRFLNEKLQ